MRRERMAPFSMTCLALGVILSYSVGAFGQLPANVMLVRGTIDGAEPGGLTVKTKDGLTRIGVTFPEAMRGLSEGHYPWDFPGTTMTNAVVADIVRRVDGPLLTLTPKGQSVQIVVPPTATIVRIDLQQVGVLQFGAGTVVVVRKETDGSLTALRVYVGQGGVMPPF